MARAPNTYTFHSYTSCLPGQYYSAHTHGHLQSIKVYIYSLCSVHYKGKHLRCTSSHSHYNNNQHLSPQYWRVMEFPVPVLLHYCRSTRPNSLLYRVGPIWGPPVSQQCRFFVSDIHTQVVQFPISHPGLASEKNTHTPHARDERLEVMMPIKVCCMQNIF
jgi:hypothetical protein